MRAKPVHVRIASYLHDKDRVLIRRAVRKHGLDRRKVYGLAMGGALATEESCTTSCGSCACDCSEGRCSHGSGGCRWCGYTGKRVQKFSDPVTIDGNPFFLKEDTR